MTAAILAAAVVASLVSGEPRIVRVTVANLSEMTAADLERVRDLANRLWRPYDVDVQFGSGPGAVIVVFAPGSSSSERARSAPVLGTTPFSNGHAQPFITLWLSAATRLAAEADLGVVPFRAQPPAGRRAILARMLGVALAHELAHYLLDTRHHSSGGLLRQGFSARDLAFPDIAALTLTREQQQRLCPAEGAARHH